MNPLAKFAGVLLAFALYVNPAWGLWLTDAAAPMDLSASIEWLEDPGGTLTLQQVLSPEVAARFTPLPAGQQTLNPGYTSSVYWVRLNLGATGEAPSDWLLHVPYGQLNEVDFFVPGRRAVTSGSRRSLDSRPYFHRHFVFPVTLDSTQQTLHFRVASSNALSVPILAWPTDTFRRSDAYTQLLQFSYFGGLLLLVVYSALLFVAVRDLRFIIYACYSGLFWLAMFAGNGFGRLFLWPDAPAFDEVAQSVFLCLSAFFAAQFSRSFFRMGERLVVLDAMLRACGWALVTIAALLIASQHWEIPIALLNRASAVSGFAIAFLVLVASIRSQLIGVREARFFLAGWSILWVGAIVAGLRIFGVLPSNPLTLHALQIASAVETLMLAVALADLVSHERRSREQAQTVALESQTRLVAVLRASEERLESLVTQRTAQLELALSEQQELHNEYVRFGSLIAHEFRNPLGIVEGQLAMLRKETELELATSDGTVRRLSIATGATRRLAAMFDRWLQSDRLRRSVETPDIQCIALAPWVANLLIEAAHRFSDHTVEIRVPADAKMWADPQMLDLAVTNLLENAAKYSPLGTPIVLEYRRRPGQVGLAVIDRGHGIVPELQERVFSDFFRADSEGPVPGLGLGLSIVRRIAQAHGGSIELDSQVKQGSVFCIWLPDNGGGERT
jgi:signal transduction histidine kinase